MPDKIPKNKYKVPSKPINLETTVFDDPYKGYCRDYIKKYFGQMSQREIARRLNIGKTTINNWSSKLGLHFKKHTSNEKFFQSWTPEMAYILGYISADGNVTWNEIKGYYSLTITAAEKDKEHLEKIRKRFNSTKPLLYGKSTKSYRLIINSKQICLDLMEFGILPRKSLILKFPNLPEEYLVDYIRGYIDGDGSLKFYKRPRSPYFELSICSGSREFIEALENKIFSKLSINSKISKTKNTCFLLRYSCKRGLALAEWIYKGADLFLIRKYNNYQEALSFRKE